MERITVGVEAMKFYPFWATNTQNEYIGFARELLDRFAATMGYDIVYVPCRLDSLFKKYYAGEFDLKFPDNPYWDEEHKKGIDITYSKGVTEYIDGTLVEPQTLGKGLDRIKNLGTVKGYTPFDYLDYIHKGQMQVQESTAFNGLIMGMLSQRIDAFYINVAIAKHVLERLKQDGTFIFDPELPHTRGEYFASSFKRPDVIRQLDEYLKTHASEVKSIQRKYKVNLD